MNIPCACLPGQSGCHHACHSIPQISSISSRCIVASLWGWHPSQLRRRAQGESPWARVCKSIGKGSLPQLLLYCLFWGSGGFGTSPGYQWRYDWRILGSRRLLLWNFSSPMPSGEEECCWVHCRCHKRSRGAKVELLKPELPMSMAAKLRA